MSSIKNRSEMPFPVALIHFAFVFELAALTCYLVWRTVSRDEFGWTIVEPIFSAVTTVGLLRRVEWGRTLADTLSMLSVLVLFIIFIPDREANADELQLFERIFGYMPSFVVQWLTLVISALIVLFPAFVINLRKEWFRDAVW